MEPIICFLDHYDKMFMLCLNFDGGVVMDTIWAIFSLPKIWLLIALMFIFGLIRHRVPVLTILIVTVFLAAAIGLSDFIASGIIKPYCERLRPSHCVAICEMLHYVDGYRGGQFGFVSSHAATSFSAFTFVSLLYRRKKVTYPLLLFTIFICYSRIYLGVHYPGDILGGVLVGATVGTTSYYGLVFTHRRINSLPSYSLVAQTSNYLFYSLLVTFSFPILMGITHF